MERNEVLERVVGSLRRVQRESGSEIPELTEDTVPLDLEGFDSVRCVDFEVILSVEFDVEVRDVLIKEGFPDKDLSVGEIVDEVLALLPEREGAAADV